MAANYDYYQFENLKVNKDKNLPYKIKFFQQHFCENERCQETIEGGVDENHWCEKENEKLKIKPLETLEEFYKKDNYPDSWKLSNIARHVNWPKNKVIRWLQTKRRIDKKKLLLLCKNHLMNDPELFEKLSKSRLSKIKRITKHVNLQKHINLTDSKGCQVQNNTASNFNFEQKFKNNINDFVKTPGTSLNLQKENAILFANDSTVSKVLSDSKVIANENILLSSTSGLVEKLSEPSQSDIKYFEKYINLQEDLSFNDSSKSQVQNNFALGRNFINNIDIKPTIHDVTKTPEILVNLRKENKIQFYNDSIVNKALSDSNIISNDNNLSLSKFELFKGFSKSRQNQMKDYEKDFNEWQAQNNTFSNLYFQKNFLNNRNNFNIETTRQNIINVHKTPEFSLDLQKENKIQFANDSFGNKVLSDSNVIKNNDVLLSSALKLFEELSELF